MTTLTDHQRDILIAILQGKNIELESTPTEFTAISYAWIFKHYFYHEPGRLRIAPSQCEDVRLHGWVDDSSAFFNGANGLPNNNHYIDISTNGFIIGGPIKQ